MTIHNSQFNLAELDERIGKMRFERKGIGREGQFWTDDERRRLEQDYYDNLGISAMALKYERPECAIMQQLQKQGCFKEAVKHRRRCPRPIKLCLCDECPSGCVCKYTPLGKEEDENV